MNKNDHGVAAKNSELPPVLKRLIQRWKMFVADVKEGYEFSIYDYENSLDGRNKLEDMLATLPPPLRQKVIPTVRRLDEQFLTNTAEIETSLTTTDRDGAWRNRIPHHMGRRLQSDLKEHGYIPRKEEETI